MPSIECPQCRTRIPLDAGFGRPGDRRFYCVGCDAVFGMNGRPEKLLRLTSPCS